MQVQILHGDVAQIARTLEENTFDAASCDPPYGLKFMTRRWDYSVPSAETWAEVLRVCKPGAHLVGCQGPRTAHRGVVAIEDGGWDVRDTLAWLYGSGRPKGRAAPEEATCLKPAYEPICLARKPFKGTIAKNMARWGVGILAIDDARVFTDWSERSESWKRSGHSAKPDVEKIAAPPGAGITCHPLGRWPANVLLDEEAAAMLDVQSGECGAAARASVPRRAEESTSFARNRERGTAAPAPFYGDKGGASMFFKVCPWAPGERDELLRFHYSAKASRKERSAGLEEPNDHPTVKPLSLTTYLATLIRPPKPGRILIPFSGSGSEIIGAMRAGWRDIVAIEQDADYVRIARARVDHELRRAA